MAAISWTKRYPSKELLKKEVYAAVDSVKETLFKEFGKNNIAGIYFKGSASKGWDSLIDYVPELSDIDIHVLFKNKEIWVKRINTLEKSIGFSQVMERNYTRKLPHMIHLPRIQLLSLNDLRTKEFYTPSPAHIVKTVYGVTYESRDVSEKEKITHAYQGIYEHKEFMSKINHRMMDSNSGNVSRYLREVFWRISALGSNTLCLLGLSYHDAWSMNRTQIYKKLKSKGQHKMASLFKDFYYYCWQYFLKKDPNDARKAIIIGCKFIDSCMKNADMIKNKR